MGNLVLTIATGRFIEIAEITVPTIRGYADRCGAEFVLLTEPLYPEFPLFEKFRVADYLGDYEKVLCVDCDLVFRWDCPDLFSLVPEDHFAALDEGSIADEDGLADRRRSADHLADFVGVPRVEWEGFTYWNTGLFVAGAAHKKVFTLPDKLATTSMADQNWINMNLVKEKALTWHLPRCYNMFQFFEPKDWMDSAYVLHAASGSVNNKIAELKRYLGHWKSLRRARMPMS